MEGRMKHSNRIWTWTWTWNIRFVSANITFKMDGIKLPRSVLPYWYSFEFACKNCSFLFRDLQEINNSQWHFNNCEGYGFECELHLFDDIYIGKCPDSHIPHIHHFNILYDQWICTACQRMFFNYISGSNHVFMCHKYWNRQCMP